MESVFRTRNVRSRCLLRSIRLLRILQVNADFRYPFILLDTTPGFSYRLSVIIRFLVSSLPRGRPRHSPTLRIIWSEIFLHRLSSCHLFVFLLPSWRQGCSVVTRSSSRVTFLPVSRGSDFSSSTRADCVRRSDFSNVGTSTELLYVITTFEAYLYQKSRVDGSVNDRRNTRNREKPKERLDLSATHCFSV